VKMTKSRRVVDVCGRSARLGPHRLDWGAAWTGGAGQRGVSNHMLSNQIQMIALITFLNNEIAIQEYIYGAKNSYMHDNFKNKGPQ
jgi:hypothetical protein